MILRMLANQIIPTAHIHPQTHTHTQCLCLYQYTHSHKKYTQINAAATHQHKRIMFHVVTSPDTPIRMTRPNVPRIPNNNGFLHHVLWAEWRGHRQFAWRIAKERLKRYMLLYLCINIEGIQRIVCCTVSLLLEHTKSQIYTSIKGYIYSDLESDATFN